MNKLSLIFLFIAGLSVLVSCHKDNPTPALSGVFVAGYESSSGVSQVTYWKDTAATVIKTTESSVGKSICLSGTDVYVAGFKSNANSLVAGVYWKNGQEVSLTDGTYSSQANSIIVQGSDVFVAGIEYSGLPNNTTINHNGVAKYWKNGVGFSLTDGKYQAYATSIFVVGNDIYVAGNTSETANGLNIAKYWKNGVAVTLTDGTTYTIARSIFVVGSDVYVAGYESPVSSPPNAVYWKNGVKTVLTNGAWAQSIFVSGSDVYVAGYGGGYGGSSGIYSVAMYWKNGTMVKLSDATSTAQASSVFVLGNDVYVAGTINSGTIPIATYWKNGVVKNLTNGTKNAFATSIYVAK